MNKVMYNRIILQLTKLKNNLIKAIWVNIQEIIKFNLNYKIITALNIRKLM